jgi:hypothetical protein
VKPHAKVGGLLDKRLSLIDDGKRGLPGCIAADFPSPHSFFVC